METSEVYDKSKEVLKLLKDWSVLDSMLVLETAKQQLLADTLILHMAGGDKKPAARVGGRIG